jgi:hypothetical protein
LFPEGDNQAGAATHPEQRFAGVGTEFPEVLGAEVWERVLLPVAPEVLDRVELGCVTREPLDEQAIVVSLNELLYEPTAVSRETIPDDEELAGHVPQQVFEEHDDLGALDGSGEEPEVEVPDRDAGNGRQQVPVEVELKDRGLASGGPGSAAVGAFAQSALVDEDDRPTLAERPLFSAGQRFRFQTRIFSSSRSRALPSGLWQLQRMRWSRHQTLLVL